MRPFAGLVVVVLAVMSGWARSAPTPTEPTPDYYPLKVGTKWHYQATGPIGMNKVFVTKVVKIEKIDGQPLVYVEAYRGGTVVANEHMSQTARGVFRHRVNGLRCSPPVCLLKFPLKKGDSWETKTKVGENTVTFTCRAGNEEVKVPAGKYKAITVRLECKIGDNKIVTTYWFAPGVGMVKQIATVGTMEITLELEKFEAGK
jgi:hypothetical protein